MADVFSNAAPEEEEDATPGLRVAGALTGGGEDAPEEEEAPEVTQPQGKVDDSGQSYLTPATADDGETGPPQASGGDVPVSADTQAYMTPIAPPTLAKPADYADHSADTAAMTAQKAIEARENVKPSVGRQILARIAGAAAAFGSSDGEKGVRVTNEVLTEPRANAEARWATQEAPIQARLNADAAADAATRNANVNTEQTNRLAEQNYGLQERGQQSAARAENYQAQAEARRNAITSFTPDDPANPYAGGTGTTADGRTMKGVPPPDKWLANWEKNPDNVASAHAQAGVKTLKALEASGVKLTSEQRAIVASGGKITPSSHTSISILENPDGSARTPAGGQGAMGPGEKIAQNMQDKQSYIDSLTENKEDVTDDKGNVLSPKGALVDKAGNTVSRQQFNDRLEKFRTDLNADPVMRKSGTMVNEKGETVSNRFSRNPTTTAAATPPPQQAPAAAAPAPVYKAKSGGTVTLNTHVIVNGRAGIVTGFDSNGKPQVTYGGGGSGPPNPR